MGDCGGRRERTGLLNLPPPLRPAVESDAREKERGGFGVRAGIGASTTMGKLFFRITSRLGGRRGRRRGRGISTRRTSWTSAITRGRTRGRARRATRRENWRRLRRRGEGPGSAPGDVCWRYSRLSIQTNLTSSIAPLEELRHHPRRVSAVDERVHSLAIPLVRVRGAHPARIQRAYRVPITLRPALGARGRRPTRSATRPFVYSASRPGHPTGRPSGQVRVVGTRRCARSYRRRARTALPPTV